MKIFILEDDPSRMRLFREALMTASVVATDNVEDAKVLYTEHQPFDLILLDHDLADVHYNEVVDGVPHREGTGTEFANWLTTTQPPDTQVIIHSYNHAGAHRMEALLMHWPCYCHPFGPNLLDALTRFVT